MTWKNKKAMIHVLKSPTLNRTFIFIVRKLAKVGNEVENNVSLDKYLDWSNEAYFPGSLYSGVWPWTVVRLDYSKTRYCREPPSHLLSFLFFPAPSSTSMSRTRLCTRRNKHDVNEHINVVSPFLSTQFFHAARSTAVVLQILVYVWYILRANRSNSRSNGDWIADKMVLFFGRDSRIAGLLGLMRNSDSCQSCFQ